MPLLSAATQEYLAHRRSTVAANTARNDARVLRFLAKSIGDMQVSSITAAHLDKHFSMRTLEASSANLELAALQAFFAWAQQRRYCKSKPTEGRKLRKVIPKKRVFIPHDRWGMMLASAPDPVTRIVLALGLYTFLRAGEMLSLRIGDLDLSSEASMISVIIRKTGVRDDMPMVSELEAEVRLFLSWYSQHHDLAAPEAKEYYLLAAGAGVRMQYDRVTRTRSKVQGSEMINPQRARYKPEQLVQRVLDQWGYPSYREGVHTLRRSGAKALYLHLAKDGHDGAIRIVQAMLHHASMATTERYIGLDLDRARRNSLLMGQRMFPEPARVIPLRRAADGQG